MKMTLSAEELDNFDAMSDSDLCAMIRDSFKEFRAKRAEAQDDAEDPPASTGGLRHGALSTSTLETAGSRAGNVNPGARDSAAVQATQAAARQVHEAHLRQADRDEEMEKLIPGYRRLVR